MRHPLSSMRALLALVALIVPTIASAQALEPIAYVIRIPEPATHETGVVRDCDSLLGTRRRPGRSSGVRIKQHNRKSA
jgi:hypothetical protein